MTYPNKKVVIWGKGSIGTRHYKNLLKMGYKVYFLRRKNKKKNEIKKRDLKNLKPLFCVICTPTIFHVRNANFCLKNNIPTYIDKPLGYEENDHEIKKILKFSKKQKIHGGFNLKYCKELNEFIKKIKKIKKIKTAEFIWRTDMRKWHPGENYKKSYAFKKSLGGGVIHTCSHEINMLNDFFDKPKFIKIKKLYKEGICSSYKAKFRDGKTNINIIVDFMCNKNERFINFFDNKKNYIFDFYRYNYKKINDISYIKSMKDFIKCIHKDRIPKSNFFDTFKTYKFLEKLNNE